MILLRKYLIVILPFLVIVEVVAQKQITTYHNDSNLILSRDPKVDELIARQKDQNSIRHSMAGYRVQIFFGSNRIKALELKNEFSQKNREVPAYLSYQAPNFKVRVGDFRTRLEALKFLRSIEAGYATCFIVPDDISLPVLK